MGYIGEENIITRATGALRQAPKKTRKPKPPKTDGPLRHKPPLTTTTHTVLPPGVAPTNDDEIVYPLNLTNQGPASLFPGEQLPDDVPEAAPEPAPGPDKGVAVAAGVGLLALLMLGR